MWFVSISSFLISIVGTFYLQVGGNFAVYCTPFSCRTIHLITAYKYDDLIQFLQFFGSAS